MGTPVARNATALVELVENYLGWDPSDAAREKQMPVWKIKALEAGKLNAAMKKRPTTVTLETLTISFDYCRLTRVEALTPYVLVVNLKKAMEAHAAPEVVTDLEGAISHAIDVERGRDDAQSPQWLGRFGRAIGPGRAEAYEEWKAAGRG